MRYINPYSHISAPSANLQRCHQHSHSPWKLQTAVSRQLALLKVVTPHECRGRLLNAGTACGLYKLFLLPFSQSPQLSPSQQYLRLVYEKVSSASLPKSYLRCLGARHEHFCKHNEVMELLVVLCLDILTFILVTINRQITKTFSFIYRT